MSPPVQLMFNVGDAALSALLDADQAVVLLENDADAQWPLDELNQAIQFLYGVGNDVPQLYAVTGNGRTIGYLARARDDRLTASDLSQCFWRALQSKEAAVGMSIRVRTPYVCSTVWNGQTVGVVAYESPFGIEVPLRGINQAFWGLFSQNNWPAEEGLYLYPVRRGEGSRMSGVLIAPSMDDVGTNQLMDDSFVHSIVECNNRKHRTHLQIPTALQPRRIS